jgi:phage regulator Rha-like protein
MNRPNSQARTVKSNKNHSTKLTTLNHGQVVTDSQTMAKVLGIRHAKLVEVLQSLFEDYPDLRDSNQPNIPKKAVLSKDTFFPFFEPYQTTNRGQTFTAYLINEAAFYLLLPRFKTETAKKAYLEFVIAFQKMKHALLQAEANKSNLLFQQMRSAGKQARKTLTDTIKDFAVYSANQGSTGHKHYYANFTRWINAALGIAVTDSPKARDALSIEIINKLDELEGLVAECIEIGIMNSKSYKSIKEEARLIIDEQR